MLSRPPSKRAANDAVLSGRIVPCVEDDTWRVGDTRFLVGEGGCSSVFAVPLVFSHDGGGFCVALLAVDCRSVACEGVVGVSFGFNGELLGVKGRTVDGEASRMEPGRRKGDWRGLLRDLNGRGVADWILLNPLERLSLSIHTMFCVDRRVLIAIT